jgi:hypothetical protein
LAERGDVLFELSFEAANCDVARTVLFFRAFFPISKLDHASNLWCVFLSRPL